MTGEGFGAGETGGSPMREPGGSAEVRSGLHTGRTGDEYAGLGFAEGHPSGVKERVLEGARTAAGTLREGASNLGHRAGEAATQARERLEDMSERTNRALEERGLLARLRENPLPALAVAFGIGFLLAGGGRQGEPSTPGARARRELRNALMAGLTAGAAQATRGFLQTAGGPEGIVETLLGRRAGGTEPSVRSPGSSASATSGRTGGTPASRGRMSGGLAGSEPTRSPSHRENA